MFFLSINVEGAEETVKALKHFSADLIDQKMMDRIGALIELGIKRRTAKGRAYTGAAFQAYSPNYAEYRMEHGRPVNFVDLFFRGHMMAAMTHKATKQEVEIFFADSQQAAKAHGHHFGYSPKGLPSRQFFGASKGDIEKAVLLIEKEIGKKAP